MRELILKVEGMVCNGCESRVQNVIMQIAGVEKVVANHKDGTVIIKLNQEISEEIIKEKIEDIGFEIKS